MEQEYTNTEEEVIEEVNEVEDEAVEEQEAEVSEKETPAPAPTKRAESQIDRLKRELSEAKAKLASNQTTGLSIEDTLAITSSGIHRDDIKEVVEYAKYKNISLSEALESPIVKMTLKENSVKREQKASTITSPNRTGGKVDEVERALAKYKKDGTLPDNNPALVSQILKRLK